jgi:hypothetical protein
MDDRSSVFGTGLAVSPDQAALASWQLQEELPWKPRLERDPALDLTATMPLLPQMLAYCQALQLPSLSCAQVGFDVTTKAGCVACFVTVLSTQDVFMAGAHRRLDIIQSVFANTSAVPSLKIISPAPLSRVMGAGAVPLVVLGEDFPLSVARGHRICIYLDGRAVSCTSLPETAGARFRGRLDAVRLACQPRDQCDAWGEVCTQACSEERR